MNTVTGRHYLSILALVILTSLAYLPGLSDFWLSDDIPNIVSNPALQVNTLDSNSLLTAATANTSGPLGRPLASLSFGLNYYFSGKQLDASDFKTTNLGIHIFNGILVYLIVFYLIKTLNRSLKKTLSETSFPLFVAAMWVLHPIQLTAVLYAVQRMASMSALFVFAGLLIFIIGRIRLSEQKPYAVAQMYIGIGLGTLLGALCKENALLLPYLALVIEITILSNLYSEHKQQRKQIITFYTLTTALPAVLALIYLGNHSDRILASYATRDFTLSERLMTESRVLLLYVTQLLYPVLQNFSLYHDNVEISRALLQPWTTLIAIISILTSAVLSILIRKKHPIIAFSILWFLVAHAMESSIFSLVLMYEHRNYVASFGIIFAAGYYTYLVINKFSKKPLITIGTPIIIILCLTGLTNVRSNIWSSQSTLSYFNIKNNPNSAQAHASRAIYILDSHGDTREAYEQLSATASLNQSDTSSLMAMLQLLEIIKTQTILGERDTETPAVQPANYYDTLIINRKYIDQLHNIIDTETSHRLSTQKLSVTATLALRNSTDCAVKGRAPQCLAIIDEIRNWLDIALQNKTLPAGQRPIILASRARINAYQGRLESAINDLDRAYREQPQEIYLLIEKLTLLTTLHDWEGSKSLIQQIETHPFLAGHHKLALTKAKQFYEFEFNSSDMNND